MKTKTIAITILTMSTITCQAGWKFEQYNGGVKIGGSVTRVEFTSELSAHIDWNPAMPASEGKGIINIPSKFDGLPLIKIDGLSFVPFSLNGVISQVQGFIVPETVKELSSTAIMRTPIYSTMMYYYRGEYSDLYRSEAVPYHALYTNVRDAALGDLNVFFKGDKPLVTFPFMTRCSCRERYATVDQELDLLWFVGISGGQSNMRYQFSHGTCWVVEGTSGWTTNTYFEGGIVRYYAAKVNMFPANQRFVDSCNISLSCVNNTATIFYTLDGSEPTTNETVNCFRYNNPFTITESTEVKALAYVPAYASFMTNRQLIVTYGKSYTKATAQPVISRPLTSPFFRSNEEVVLTCSTPNAVIRYTTDGSEVTSDSTAYAAPFPISETTTIRAKAFCEGLEESDELSETLVRDWLTVTTPTIIPVFGTFANVSQEVNMSCDTDGVIILYTTDGSDPTVNGMEYKKPFSVYESCTVRAIAKKYDYRDSGEASVTFTRADGLSEAVNLYGYLMENDSNYPWTVVTDVSHDGVSCVRSGAIDNNGTTAIQTSVKKAGTLSFWWRAACEEPDVEDGEDGYYDYGVFVLDGAETVRIAGNDTGWQFFSTNITTGGKHVFRWEYHKDGATTYAPDCVWLDQVQWIPADGSGYTLTTPDPVPYSWLSGYGLGLDSDFETAAKQLTGKTSATGKPMAVWQDFVAGTNPTDSDDFLRTMIAFSNGVPYVSWSPNLNTNGEVRVYTILGKTNLTDAAWGCPTNVAHRFFKVKVEMP